MFGLIGEHDVLAAAKDHFRIRPRPQSLARSSNVACAKAPCTLPYAVGNTVGDMPQRVTVDKLIHDHRAVLDMVSRGTGQGHVKITLCDHL